MADKFGRAEWGNYNMAMAMLAAVRSIDPRTKHGCYIVTPNNKPISTGYNGPIRGIDDKQFSLKPPGKYFEIIHSEENAILNCYEDLSGTTVYVTGHPCSRCLKMMIQAGIKRIVWGPIDSVRLGQDEEEWNAIKRMIDYSGVELVKFEGNFWEPFVLLIKYLATKGISPNRDLLSAISNAICDVDIKVDIPVKISKSISSSITSIDMNVKELLGDKNG